jgi:hypothetical protein
MLTDLHAANNVLIGPLPCVDWSPACIDCSPAFPLLQVSTYKCECGAEAAQRPCSQQQWHCTRPCGKPLACGRHTCQLVCHAGPACPACAFSGACVATSPV